jgi:hypothetical protein
MDIVNKQEESKLPDSDDSSILYYKEKVKQSQSEQKKDEIGISEDYKKEKKLHRKVSR